MLWQNAGNPQTVSAAASSVHQKEEMENHDSGVRKVLSASRSPKKNREWYCGIVDIKVFYESLFVTAVILLTQYQRTDYLSIQGT